MFILTFVTALGSGLVAGMFYAFSSFIMKALGNLPPARGAEAMQRINIDVINPWFMLFFMGTAATSIALSIWTLFSWETHGSVWRLVGAACYVVGTFGVTAVFNVPLNNRLARVDPNANEAAQLWAYYLKAWTMWNTVRTVAALIGSAALVLALCG